MVGHRSTSNLRSLCCRTDRSSTPVLGFVCLQQGIEWKNRDLLYFRLAPSDTTHRGSSHTLSSGFPLPCCFVHPLIPYDMVDSKVSTISAMASKPDCQNATDLMLIPIAVRTVSGLSDPPAASNFR